MPFHVFDFRWQNEDGAEIQASYQHKFGRKPVKIGDEMSLSIVFDGKKCAGSYSENAWQKCSQQSEGKAKCDLCRSREKSFVFTAFDGFNTEHVTPEDLARISGPHVVYLALFNPDLIKVGVSHAERKALRQIEQGSHATLYIAHTPDGVSARQIETLFRSNGLADKIKPSQKKDFLDPDVSTKEARNILKALLESKKSDLKDYTNLQSFLLPEPEFQTWENVYGLPKMRSLDKPFHSVSLQKDESVSGKITAMKGPFVVIETPEELVSVCMKDFYGHEVDFSPQPAGLKINAALQNALF